MSQKERPLFVLSIARAPGGYSAQARVATHDGYMLFCSSVKKDSKEWKVSGFDNPKAKALDDVLTQAQTAIQAMDDLVPGYAKKAVIAVRGTRELALMAADGDDGAIVGLRWMAGSRDPLLRKAVRAQRLFRE